MQNKRILVLSPYAIPASSPEAICNAKLVKALSGAGYAIDLIGKNNATEYIPDTTDAYFSGGLASLKIFDVKHKITLRTVTDHLRTLLKTGYVYEGAQWAAYAIAESERLIRQNHYDAILSRVPPSELAALYLSKKYGIKWIANWNDPYPNKCFPAPYGAGAAARVGSMRRKLFGDIARNAALHTFPCQRLRDYMSGYMQLPEEKTLVIPHICIDGLFDGSAAIQPHSRLRIVHAGNIAAPRSPLTLFEGLQKFRQQHPEAEFEVAFIGKQDDNFHALIRKSGLDNHIKVLPPVDYIANLKLMSGYDAALLVEANVEEGIFLPTKAGDYMQSRLPIWAVSPQKGTLNDLYTNKKIAYFANATDSHAIAGEMTVIYNDFISHNGILPRQGIIDEYSAETVLRLYETIM